MKIFFQDKYTVIEWDEDEWNDEVLISNRRKYTYLIEKDYNGSEYYYKNEELHREDGPAIIYVNRSKEWWVNGELHRTDGPAIEYASGHKYWWYQGEEIHCNSTEEFVRLIKLRSFW